MSGDGAGADETAPAVSAGPGRVVAAAAVGALPVGLMSDSVEFALRLFVVAWIALALVRARPRHALVWMGAAVLCGFALRSGLAFTPIDVLGASAIAVAGAWSAAVAFRAVDPPPPVDRLPATAVAATWPVAVALVLVPWPLERTLVGPVVILRGAVVAITGATLVLAATVPRVGRGLVVVGTPVDRLQRRVATAASSCTSRWRRAIRRSDALARLRAWTRRPIVGPSWRGAVAATVAPAFVAVPLWRSEAPVIGVVIGLLAAPWALLSWMAIVPGAAGPRRVAARGQAVVLGAVGWRDGSPRRGPLARVLELRFALAAWTTTALVVNLVVFMVAWGPGPLRSTGRLTVNRQSWDYWLYAVVADQGYVPNQGLEAIFPGLPLLQRSLRPVVGDDALTAVLVSFVAGAAACVLMWVWLGQKGVARPAREISVLAMLLHPFGFHLVGSTYPDAALVALALGALVLSEAARPVGAGLVGAVATFVRPNGLALVGALVVGGLQRGAVLGAVDDAVGRPGSWRWLLSIVRGLVAPGGIRWRRLRPVHLAGLASLLGVGAFSIFLQRARGDALAFFTVQKDFYGHPPVTSLSSWARLDFLRQIDQWAASMTGPLLQDEIVAAISTLLAIAWLPKVAHRFGLGYSVLVLAVVAMYFAGADSLFTPGGRLLVVAIPLYAIVGEWLAERPRLCFPALAASVVLMLSTATGFARATCCW